MAAAVRGEVDALAGTSKDLRARVLRAADAMEDRLANLDALLDILHEEVEGTVLDVSAALHTARRGVSIFGSLKRAFLGRR